MREAFAGLKHADGLPPSGALKAIVPLVRPEKEPTNIIPKGTISGRTGSRGTSRPRLDKDRGRLMNLLLHPEIDEGISISEAMRLSSFPDGFRLIGDYKTKWARLGNAVMPRFMYHIAKAIREGILDRIGQGGRPETARNEAGASHSQISRRTKGKGRGGPRKRPREAENEPKAGPAL